MKLDCKTGACGCCEGVEKLTPLPTANRPGLERLSYRVGTHGSFLETMKACLSEQRVEEKDPGTGLTQVFRPLEGLTTRDPADPAIALLDAWATVADVLTFYQERVANEGYLRTASQRRSLLELGRLVGYRPRPGVAASTYLAFTLDEGYQVEIPEGTRAQSLPEDGQLPQSFEAAEPLAARAEWNVLEPRLSRPQRLSGTPTKLYLKGTATNLKPNDMLLLDSGNNKQPYRVLKVDADSESDRTGVAIEEWDTLFASPPPGSPAALALNTGLPSVLHAGPLRALHASLNEMAALSPGELGRLLFALSEALLETFKVVMSMSPSPVRDAAVKQTISAMQAVETALKTILGNAGQNTVVGRAVAAMLDWLGDALAILHRGAPASKRGGQIRDLKTLVGELLKPVPVEAIPPRSAAHLPLPPQVLLGADSDLVPQLMVEMHTPLKQDLYAAWADAQVTQPQPVKVYAMRTTISPSGHNAPKEIKFAGVGGDGDGGDGGGGGVILANPALASTPLPPSQWDEWGFEEDESQFKIYLEREVDSILADSPVVVQFPKAEGSDDFETRIVIVSNAIAQSRNAYGLSVRTTVLNLAEEWRDSAEAGSDAAFIRYVRRTTVYTESEELELAEEPIAIPLPDGSGSDEIELDVLYEGLKPGRWLIISGEDANLSGVQRTELAMLANVDQVFDSTLPGDKVHSRLKLANRLAYRYKRDTVTIYGNVARATHGETRNEVLGNGDGSLSFQHFQLKQPPLTYLPAPNPSGVESTLQVRVDDVRWPKVEDLFQLKGGQRGYITRTDDKGNTRVIFGDGEYGRRLPTGAENVRATYRNGIGKPGNVPAQAISLLLTPHLGVSKVINPLPATGGTEPENAAQIRANVPAPLRALERLVSVQDYADFARTFAGIGKASAVRLSDGHRELIHLTVAGADDIPIAETSDLYRNLVAALQRFGDPFQPFEVAVRNLMVLLVWARVRVSLDYEWETVVPKIRAALLAAFGFERRQLGQDVVKSEVLSVIQSVPGVAYVDLDLLAGIPEDVARDPDRLARRLAALELALRTASAVPPEKRQPQRRVSARLAKSWGMQILPAQIAYLSPDMPATLSLEEITE